MLTSIRYALLLLIAVAIVTPQVPVLNAIIGIEEAHAQKKKRKSLFDVLFKRRNKNKNKQRNSNRTKPLENLPGVNLLIPNSKRKKRNTTPSPTKPAVVVVKKENAAKILVVGDFMATGLASGLERLYADNSNFIVVKNTNPSSGIVRDDVVDWNAKLPELIQELKPVVVLSLVGMNDRQQMRLESGRVEKLDETWKTEYNKRITGLASAGQASKTPIIWVGLPPVNSSRMNADYLAFNEMYRSNTEAVGGTFVDVWDGFTNAEGKFVSAGPDINGQIVRLRGAKGINMTRAGKAKLAFFADRALRKLGIVKSPDGIAYAGLDTQSTNLSQPGVPEYDPASTGKTAVISLSSPSLDGGNLLEGEEGYLDSDEQKESVSFELVENGLPKSTQPGRVDSGWGKPKSTVKEKTQASETN